MVDLLQTALSGLSKMLPHRQVRYQRGESYVDLESATVAVTTVDYEDEHGVRLKAEIRDYLISPADLILDDVQVEPQESDEIIDTNEGGTKTYVVMGIEAGVAWRYTDRYHTMFRIHTREADEV